MDRLNSTTLKVQKIAAFSDGSSGGNPAGVVIVGNLPTAEEMQRVAAEVGFSETVFAEPAGKAGECAISRLNLRYLFAATPQLL